MEGLNPEQAAAVTMDHGRDGVAFVLAGAGSGKTTVITRRITYLAATGYKPDCILALTFTKDAAGEMSARVISSLRNCAPTVAGAVPPLSDGLPTISTFHGFAFSLLKQSPMGIPNWRRMGFLRRPQLMEDRVRRGWLLQSRKPLGLEHGLEVLERWVEDPFDVDADEADELPALIKIGGKTKENEEKIPGRKILRTAYREYLRSEGLLSFDHMVSLALRMMESQKEVLEWARAKYTHILVDEFQDTSPEQLELVKVLAGNRDTLFLVGDDDQAIYSFRGADLRNIDKVFALYPRIRVIKLETNYRSTPSIIHYANSIFSDKSAHLRKRLVARTGEQSPLFLADRAPIVKVHDTSLDESRWMVEEMERLRRELGFKWSDFAVLYRLNALEAFYRDALRKFADDEAGNSVILKTIHGAKGLQYPVVFLMGLEDGICPYRRHGKALGEEAYAEEKRLFYVGVTRAEYLLYMCASRRRMLGGKYRHFSPSPFLTECGHGIGRSLHRWGVRMGRKLGRMVRWS